MDQVTSGEVPTQDQSMKMSLLSENVRRVLSENVRSMCVGRAPLTPRLWMSAPTGGGKTKAPPFVLPF